MKSHQTQANSAMKYMAKCASCLLIAGLSFSLVACGGGGGGGSSSTVTNNGSISNPQNYTMPSGGVSTVPPTGTQ